MILKYKMMHFTKRGFISIGKQSSSGTENQRVPNPLFSYGFEVPGIWFWGTWVPRGLAGARPPKSGSKGFPVKTEISQNPFFCMNPFFCTYKKKGLICCPLGTMGPPLVEEGGPPFPDFNVGGGVVRWGNPDKRYRKIFADVRTMGQRGVADPPPYGPTWFWNAVGCLAAS